MPAAHRGGPWRLTCINAAVAGQRHCSPLPMTIRHIAFAVAVLALLLSSAPRSEAQHDAVGHPLLPAPIWVYNNWSAYDELSDEVPLTEGLAMRELAEMVRLRRLGVRLDYYVMDAFWYDPDGGYRRWRRETWSEGPDRWLAALKANGIKAGLWFSTNTLTHMRAAPAWRSSLAANGWIMSMATGGFLADFMDVLHYWYGRGIRLFKFDMADFNAAAKNQAGLPPQEIRRRNLQSFHAALQAFRRRHPDVVLVGFNGLVGNVETVEAPVASFNARWLDIFDTFYAGDPRPSNVPEMNFWRSVDIYSDEMVRSFEQAGIPLPRIDSTSFMIGGTGTNYQRRTAAWRGSLLLMVAHGGWVNTVHGDLERLSDDDARWIARVQALYDPLQRGGVTKSFGGIPGDGQPYGFGSVGRDGALYVVLNPSERVRRVRMPQLSPTQGPLTGGRLLFRDAGFDPVLERGSIELGPGQLALIGFGHYASAAYDLGIEPDMRIPTRIAPLPVQFYAVDADARITAVEAVIMPPASGGLRIILRQRDAHGAMMRSHSKEPMGRHFVIRASQGGKPLPVEIHYDRVVWSGLAWAAGEIPEDAMTPGKPVRLRLSAPKSDPSLLLQGRVYSVQY
jgi:hypothetical protein